MKHLVIIGGSDAAISAALRARELEGNVDPLIVTADNFPNFSICGLPYYVSRDVALWKNLAHRTVEEIGQSGIRMLLKRAVSSVDPENKQVITKDVKGNTEMIGYDKLIMATGGLSVRPNIPGLDHRGVFFLRWVPESIAIDEFINEQKPENALIIGAGYIGMEMSEALAKRGIKVTVVEFLESVLPSVDAVIGDKVRDMLRINGITVHNGISVESITGVDDRLIVKGSGGFEILTDMVLVSVGSMPNNILGKSIGISTGIKGAFQVNLKMETNLQDIYAAGDCCETWHRMLQKYTYLPLGTTAHKQGRIAGENAVGGNAEYAGSLGTQSVKIFESVTATTGLNDKEAIEAGYKPLTVDFEAWDHKQYYPGAKRMLIRVTADKKKRIILGAQILGAYGSEISKRIDIVATALYHGATIDEFSRYDLSYTPPLSSPWDPVQMAMQNMERALDATPGS